MAESSSKPKRTFTPEHKAKLAAAKKGKPSWNKGKKLDPEHRKNLSLSHMGNPHPLKGKKNPKVAGENHYNWKGGKSTENQKIRTSAEYKLWRKAVFMRDNYTCIWGGKAHGSKLNADHIKPFAYFPELRFAIDNGRTLCEACHKTTDSYGAKRRNV